MSKKWYNFSLFALGTLISNIGSGAQAIALPLYILDLTGSGTLMGILVFLSYIPKILLSPIAGVFGDRINRKYLMVGLDYARGVIVFILGLFAYLKLLNIKILFIAQILISILDTFFSPATSAMVADLVEKDELVRANSILGIVGGISNIIGPIIGGVIYSLGGILFIFIINAISFLGSASFEIFIKYTPHKIKSALTFSFVMKEIKEGALFIIKKRGLIILMGFSMFMNFLFNPFFQIVLPFIVRRIFEYPPYFLGFLEGMFVVGILITNILLSMFLAKKDTGTLMKVGVVILEFTFLSFLYSLSPLGANRFFMILFAIGIGFSIPFIDNPAMANIMKMSPSIVRSRVMSMVNMLSQMMSPLGALLFGLMLDKIPYYFLLIAIGVFTLSLSILFVFWAPREVFYPV